MDKMFRFNFYKEWYYKELDRRDQLANALNIPIGILTAIFGLVSYILLNFKYNSNNTCVVSLFILFISLTILSIISTMILLLISYTHKYKFKTFPLEDFLIKEYINVENDVNQFNVKIDDYNKIVEDCDKIEDSERKNIEVEYENNLCNVILSFIKFNAECNDIKSFYIFRAKIALLISFTLTFISLGIYILNHFK